MIERPGRLFVVVLILGWSFDFLFWKSAIGINFPIFTTLCLLGGIYLLRSADHRPHPRSLWLLVPYIFFSITALNRQEPLTRSLAFTFTFLSLGLLVVSILGGRWAEFGFLDHFQKLGRLGISMASRGMIFINDARVRNPDSARLMDSLPVSGVLRGLLIALPVVFFFSHLLSSADVVFERELVDFLDKFSFEQLVEYVYRTILILLYAYMLAGVFLHAEAKSRNERLVGEEQPVVKPFLGFTESAIVLASVTALFAFFVVIQFQYFFGGEVNIGIEGLTYSQYARRGFSELNSVAFFSLLLILGLNVVTRRDTGKKRRIFSGLNVALLSQVLIILVSSYQRVMLAIGWHGYSRLRIYPRIFLIWLGLLLVAVVVLEIVRRERFIAFSALMASMGFAAALSLINVDAAIVDHNVSRALEGKHFNYRYLADLSLDAVPALAEHFTADSLDSDTREGVGAALICYRYALEPAEERKADWRAFDLSTWNAQRSIDKLDEYLDGYLLNDRPKPVRVKTPDGERYDCPASKSD